MPKSVTERYVWEVQLLTSQKSISRPGLWKGKFGLFQVPATVGGGRQASVQRLTFPHPPAQTSRGLGVGESINRVRGGGLHAETAQSSLTVIFKLVISGLTSIILIVLGTVNLQFQSPFVPVSLQSVLGTVAAHVLAVV